MRMIVMMMIIWGCGGVQAQVQVSLWGKYSDFGSIKKKALNIPEVKQLLATCLQEERQKLESNKEATLEMLERQQAICFSEKLKAMPPAQAIAMAKQLDSDDPDLQESMLYEQNPAYLKLQAYLKKKLEEALYGTVDVRTGRKGKLVDHRTFYDLYETQLGKYVVSLLSYYCVNMDDGEHISEDPTERAKTRAENIKKLAEFEAVPIAAPTAGQGNNSSNNNNNNNAPQTQNMNQGLIHFHNCIGNLNPACESGSGYGQQLACATMRQIKELRKALLAVKEIKLVMDREKEKDKVDTNVTGFDMREFDGVYGKWKSAKVSEVEKDIEELTTLTSNELMNKSGLGNELAMDAQKFQANCASGGGGGPACQRLMYTGADVQNFNKTQRDEYDVRTAIMKKKIQGMSAEEVKQFLLKEGRTQQEVAQIVQAASQNAQVLQERIAAQYERERNAMIQMVVDKYNKHNLQNVQDQKIAPGGDASSSNSNNPEERMKKIAEELKDRPADIRDAFHYNNIVMGYLSKSVPQKGVPAGATKDNPKVTYLELDDSAFNPVNRAAGGAATILPAADPAYFQKLQAQTKQNLQRTQGKDSANTITSSTVEIPAINSIVGNYLSPGSIPPQASPTAASASPSK
ncbi:MAG: hypothetical protein HQK50_04135 [Oligoflexia bacterium]|nr:hypothetical protein [Oligoflexia bacterium]